MDPGTPARSRARAGLLPLLAGLAALAGCGGSKSFEDPADLANAADQICTDAAERTLVAFNETLPTSPVDFGIPYYEMVEEITADELAALEDLEPPERVAEGYSSYLERRRDAASVLSEAREALEAENQSRFDAAVASREAILSDADGIGAEIGLRACANVLGKEDTREARRVVRLTATSDDAEQLCRDYATASFRSQFGGLRACIESQSVAPRAGSAGISEVKGVDGVRARAFVSLEGRDFGSGADFVVDLAFEDGGWRVQVVRPLR